MEEMRVVFQVVILLVALKAMIGIHWPWELIVKAKKSLRKDLDAIKDLIPEATYASMNKAIENIY